MLLKVSDNSSAEAYFNWITDIYCVNEIIQIYTSWVFKKDQSIQFVKFMKSDSCICIMIITISLEMRVNILNVKCTVIWRFLISNDIVNVWQCVKCEERDFNQINHIFIFLKYWVFDLKDCENLKNNYNVSQIKNYKIFKTESVEIVTFTQS